MGRRQRASAGRDEPVRGEAAVAEYAEMMRGSFWARDSSLEAGWSSPRLRPREKNSRRSSAW
jgi:hypothetical protein